MQHTFEERFQTAVDQLLTLEISERDENLETVCAGDTFLAQTVRAHLTTTNQLSTDTEQSSTSQAFLSKENKALSHYKIESQIGIGGMGVVYKAIDTRLDRTVALKFLSPVLCQDEQARKRFLTEAKAISQFDHANVCSIYDMGETDEGQLYFAMPYYEGKELVDILKKGEVKLELIIDIMIQTCKGIHAAHSKGIIHRDLKPANIFYTNDGDVKVLDFGIAKLSGVELTQTGQRMGTILYMSPEQVNADPIDHRTDIWSLGVIFYEIVTGKRPFVGKTAITISQKIVACEHDPVSKHLDKYPKHVEDVINKTLAVKPSERYSDLSEMITDLELIQEEIKNGNFKDVTVVSLPAESSTTSDNLSGTLLEISKSLEDYLGDSARILVKTYSKSCEDLSDLKSRLASEIPLESRQEFMEKVKALGESKKPEKAKSKLPLLICAGLLIAGAIFGFLALTGKKSGQSTVDTHVDFRGVTKDKIRLGMTAAFSGPSKELGRSMEIGLKTAFAEINDAGGIENRQVELTAMDDAYEPEKAKANVNKLLNPEDGVFAFIGNVGTPTAKALLPTTLKESALVFGTFSGAQILRRVPPDSFVFNYRASYAEEVTSIIKYYTEDLDLNPNKIAVFYQDDSYGKDVVNGIKTALRHLNVHAPEYLATYKRNSIDVDEGVKSFLDKKENIEAVIIIGTYKASAVFTKKMRDGGYKGQIANVSFVGTSALVEEFKTMGSQYAENVLISQVVPYYNSFSECAINFRKALEKYHPNEKADFVSFEGYIIANIFAEALKRNGRKLDTVSFIQALHSINDFDLGTGQKFSFGKSNHQASHYVWGVKLDAKANIKEITLPVTE
ncbi:MAG: ABC transporter substrate-binding protein [Lentisphaeraceae bacterium]|nr:ABC transporter substrate-binding protein [Lentisphaeraceae bacterium]